jgi:hypothetical protein
MKRTPLKPVSAKRRKRDQPYSKARRAVHQRGDGICEFAVCLQAMTDVHHIAGRKIPDPHNLNNLIGLCRTHHQLAHENPEWARKVGLMKTRLGVTE